MQKHRPCRTLFAATNIVLTWLILMLSEQVVAAHPGRTDAAGCHTCRTNCPKWGLDFGEYHCHNSGRSRPQRPPQVKRSPKDNSASPKQESRRVEREQAISPQEEHFLLKVIRVVDGDTVVAMLGGRHQWLHLHDVDAPELDQPFGEEASRHLEDLILGRSLQGVTVKILSERHRSVRIALPDGRDLGLEMVARGWGWCRAGDHPATSPDLLVEQAMARAQRLGLWRDEDPLHPAEWRRLTRPSKAQE